MATATEVNPAADILNSWKDIARYLDRGVRTVQRWEVELGLPVRRPHGRGRSAVFAMRSDLDSWLRSCPAEKLQNGRDQQAVTTTTRELLLDAQRLRTDMADSRVQLGDAILRLVRTLGKMVKESSHP
ncbi:MAG TPA: hypothetical protein VKW06_16240 [Candidatus Angelobacter sp.]|nr:hypothetical protein [Candidatus Angelobacter sp.]